MKRRLAILVPLVILGIAGLVVLAGTNPSGNPWLPKCLFHELTGLHCPGCGITRALHAMFQGRFAEALGQNPLVVICLPLIAYGVVLEGAAWLWGERYQGPRVRWPRWAYWPLMITVFGYWILRNVPAWPFTLLAPH